MDFIPPSYESATDRDAWVIIAHYIPSSDLCAASLVCHRWHDLFMPFLWGDPASHFGTENDAVYVALTRFRRTLKYARREVRSLTHTLHLPPALSEIYDGPRPGWLRDILEFLPCLQCLMVSRLPFFDHNSMVALKNQNSSSQYNIRLLLAEHEPNTTSAGLAETLLHFPLLSYLNLSYTTSARDRYVLSSLSQLEHLQVLKLRGIGLKDTDAGYLANAIGKRVRFLDLRDNMLTDMAVRSLLQASFFTASSSQQSRSRTRSSPDPIFQISKHALGIDIFNSSKLDEHLLKLLARPTSNRHWIEDLSLSGITHLYIANNQITVEGVVSLLSSGRLHALDVGTVNTADFIQKKTSSPKSGKYPGGEKFAPLLRNVAGNKMVYFRAHHAVVTVEPPSKEVPMASGALGVLPELAGGKVSHPTELDASHEAQIYEVPGEVPSIHELADTSITQSAKSVPIFSRIPEPLPAPRRGSAFAPEVIEGMPQGNDNTSASTDYLEPVSGAAMDTLHTHRIQELLAKRPNSQSIPLQNGKESYFPYLHPSHIPQMETLVLTGVPSHIAPDSSILGTLIRFITACSNEALLAALQAGSDYSLPPGQARIIAEQQRSRSLFGLRQIILEITPTDNSRSISWKPANQRNGLTVSSTGDRDSEALWAAATDDFSFFGEEECGIPESDPSKYFPMAILNEKVSLIPSDDDDGTESSLPIRDISQRVITSSPEMRSPSHRNKKSTQHPPQNLIDLVAELAAFRRSKKAEYEQVMRRERGRLSTDSSLSGVFTTTPHMSMAHFVEGHWKGEVKIVRNPTPKVRSGMVDIYGNYFEGGYLYP
ncbi:hypothetical protein N7495_001601 [Penicillium taxi]|uniref:uncharacterized protein n=1 Tax=Penicillium taxi TaxID=168475 RepID=UPI002545329A|nr:uncharacterized protein N7495_001601 [Penicillium taxi]KAJ5908919.1 hypothetical protein N7495_001601 [Penicillium taxi]